MLLPTLHLAQHEISTALNCDQLLTLTRLAIKCCGFHGAVYFQGVATGASNMVPPVRKRNAEGSPSIVS